MLGGLQESQDDTSSPESCAEDSETSNMETFLASMGAPAPSNVAKDKETKKREKEAAQAAKKQAQEEAKKQKEQAKLQKEEDKQKKAEERSKKWQEDLDNLSNCPDNLKQKNLRKMINLINIEMRTTQKALKENHDLGLKQSLSVLEANRAKLETALVDEPSTEDSKKLLNAAALVMKHNKKLLSKQKWGLKQSHP